MKAYPYISLSLTHDTLCILSGFQPLSPSFIVSNARHMFLPLGAAFPLQSSLWDALLLHPHISGSILTFHAQEPSLTTLFSHPCLPPFFLNPCDFFFIAVTTIQYFGFFLWFIVFFFPLEIKFYDNRDLSFPMFNTAFLVPRTQ